jgi:Cdc6-like AAA superfamily ATPase
MATSRQLNEAFIKLVHRAEQNSRENLVSTFVDTGSLQPLLTSRNHTILYGRRGTGKTHALAYLSETVRSSGEVCVSLDLRTIDSSGSLYSDPGFSPSEKALRLLSDVITAIAQELTKEAIYLSDTVGLDLGNIGSQIDRLSDSVRDLRVAGEIKTARSVERVSTDKATSGAELRVGPKEQSVSISGGGEAAQEIKEKVSEEFQGTPVLHIEFGEVADCLRKIVDCLGGRRLWIIIDEWSVIPLELQVYLADLLRRTCFSIPKVIGKIAAIEHRSSVYIQKLGGGYIGFEPGADISIAVSLDDFLVFDNDREKSRSFFQSLIHKHVVAELTEADVEDIPQSVDSFISASFSSAAAFDELVRAAEGVPRDAFNILGLAAQRSGSEKIQMETVREAARSWYERDKEQAVRANQSLQDLLDWIINEVIGVRKARAFLIAVGIPKVPIDRLFDERILHVLKKNISSAEGGGLRYDVYKLDFGCYVHLMKGASAPQGLLPFDGESEGTAFVEVPPDDYRSIRRAILDIEDFWKHYRLKGQ